MSLRFAFLLCLTLQLILIGCGPNSVPVEDPIPEVPQPIPLGESGSKVITFQKVVFRIPTGAVLGEARMKGKVITELRWDRSSTATAEFNVAVTDAFRDLGYDMRDAADALFDASKTLKVRYELAGILHRADLDFEYQYDRRQYRVGEGVGTADVQVEVQLHDLVKGKTVYSRTFDGHGEDHGLKPSPITSAVVDAVTKSTTDLDFVRIVALDMKPEEVDTEPGERDQTEVVVCRPTIETSLPAGLPTILESVVDVQVGAYIGTGVLISSDGWILTANHVIADGSEIWIRLNNGIRLPATTRQTHPNADVALLKIQGRDFPCVTPRRAVDDLEHGSEVFAINVAFGEDFKPTVSRGIVAGYPTLDGRRYVQTDASINPGSSGGPLFAPNGRVVGITVAKTFGVGFEGLGFAVPIDDVLRSLVVKFRSD